MKLLYEDADIVVCVKPAGILSQGDSSGKENMVDLLQEHFRSSGSLAVAYPVHRLDKATTGLLVYAKTHSAAGRLSAAVQNRNVRKEYLAVLRGHPDTPSGTLTDHLLHDKRTNTASVVPADRKGAKSAVLDYTEVARTEETSLVRILLHTGRTHQIRVQFASRGLPLVGDDRYGEKDWEPLALCACRLSFPHPANGKRMDFTYLPPQLAGYELSEALLKD